MHELRGEGILHETSRFHDSKCTFTSYGVDQPSVRETQPTTTLDGLVAVLLDDPHADHHADHRDDHTQPDRPIPHAVCHVLDVGPR